MQNDQFFEENWYKILTKIFVLFVFEGQMMYKLYKTFSHCRARTSFFSIRVVNVQNDLPADIVDFRSL